MNQRVLNDGQYHFVHRCFLPITDRSKADWWDPYPAYTVNSGTASNPITIKNYPGETPVLDCSGFTNFDYSGGSITNPRAVGVSGKCYWVIDGLDITGGIVNIWGGDTLESNTHDITIRNCDIHDVTEDGGDNPGLVRIDRGNVGGAYNIFIQNNKLHDLYDWQYPGDWTVGNGAGDYAHFGAFTELSIEQVGGIPWVPEQGISR